MCFYRKLNDEIYLPWRVYRVGYFRECLFCTPGVHHVGFSYCLGASCCVAQAITVISSTMIISNLLITLPWNWF